jgi:hypothetical protein
MDETQHEKTATEEKGEKKKAGGRKKTKMFNDRNCDIDAKSERPRLTLTLKAEASIWLEGHHLSSWHS